MSSPKITFVRHGETDWNKLKKWQGHSDVFLNSEGIRQAEKLSLELDTIKFDKIFTSDLARARQTAEIVARNQNVDQIIEDSRLREINIGQLEGLTLEDVKVNYTGDQISKWYSFEEHSWFEAFPMGESKADVQNRFLDFFSENCCGDVSHIALLSHGLFIGIVLNKYSSIPAVPLLNNCGYITLQLESLDPLKLIG